MLVLVVAGLALAPAVQARSLVGLLLDRPSRPFRVDLSSRITLQELLSATRGKWRKPV